MIGGLVDDYDHPPEADCPVAYVLENVPGLGCPEDLRELFDAVPQGCQTCADDCLDSSCPCSKGHAYDDQGRLKVLLSTTKVRETRCRYVRSFSIISSSFVEECICTKARSGVRSRLLL